MTQFEVVDTGEPPALAGKHNTRGAQDIAPSPMSSFHLNGSGNRSIGDCLDLAQLWAYILQVQHDTIGHHDNFFQLGGDSLTAIRLANAAMEAGLMLSVEQVFLYPVLGQMAQLPFISAHVVSNKDLGPFSMISGKVNVEQCILQVADTCGVRFERVEDIYPVTPLQEGLLALTAKSQGDYILQSRMVLAAEVNIDRFKKAWEQTCEALPILRTRIVEHDTLGFLQVVLNEGISWTSALNLDVYIKDDKAKGMSLGQPLVRYALIYEQERNSVSFVWTLHHALYDRVTLQRMQRVFCQLYNSKTIEKPPAFRNYVEHLMRKSPVSLVAFWEWATLEFDSETFPALPAGISQVRPDISVQRQIVIPRCKSDNTASTGTVTTAMLIRAAWTLIIYYNTGADDIVFGATLSGRSAPIPGINDMIGPTIATVPVRVRVPMLETTVAEFLEDVQEQAADMMPFEHAGLQQIARINRESQQACNFQTILTVQHANDDELSCDDASIGSWQKMPQILETATYPLAIVCTLDKDCVEVVASVDSRVLEVWRTERILTQLGHTIGLLASSSPGTKLKDLDHIMPSDLKMIWEWNKGVPLAIEQTLHDVVTRKGIEQPDAIAIEAWDGKVTYFDLENMTTRLAYYLIEKGVCEGAFVPLVFEKSKWAIISTLAVLKTGAAFVPLGAMQEKDRRENILKQVNAHIVLTSDQYHSLSFGSEMNCIQINQDLLDSLDDPRPHLAPLPLVTPQDIAYAIFTSGSTGVPKGVPTQHQAIVTSSTYHGALMGLDSSSRVLQFSTYIFDASIGDIFTTLIAGGTICTVTEASLRNDLAGSLHRMQANTLLVTPSVARLIQPEETPYLTKIMLAGEAPLPADFERWKHITVFQGYGPTECAVLSTLGHMNQTQSVDNRTRDIGRATGCVGWIVDPEDHNKLMPVGAVGELLIEGPIVAQGYLNDPVKTADAFITDPDWLLEGNLGLPGRRGRLYKTGDLAQYGVDGALLYIGRKDTQVKVRGQRLELEGVEHNVLQCLIPKAQHVVAEVVQAQGEVERSVLAAFLVFTPGKDQDVENEANQVFDGVGIRPFSLSAATEDQLARQLPSYMIPTMWFVIDQLPLNASGKTDRKRLRAAGSACFKFSFTNESVGRKVEKLAPQTDSERTLVCLWAQVLGLEEAQIGANDNFFRLGGDSIVAMKLVSASRKAGLIITVALIFQHPRLADLATFLAEVDGVCPILDDIPPFSLLARNLGHSLSYSDRSLLGEQLSQICSVDATAILDAYPCTPLQEGLLALSSVQTGNYVLQSVLEMSRSVYEPHVRRAWEQTVQDLPILRSRIVQHLTLGLIQVVIGEDVEWQTGHDLDEYLKQDKLLLMSLGKPLGRYGIIDDKKTGKKYLIVTVHHALYDGESWNMVQEHFSNIYDERVASDHHVSFNQVVKIIMDTDGSAAQSFWQKSFSGYNGTAFPPLPSTERDINADTTIRSDSFKISSGLEDRLEVTIASVVRAAWAFAVHQYTGADDIVFGALLSGRNMAVADIDRIVGPTIATVPIRVRIPQSSGSPLVSTFLQDIQDAATAMIPFEQTGLQHIAKFGVEVQQACNFQTLLVVNTISPGNIDMEEGRDSPGKWLQMFETKEFTTYAVTINCNLSAKGAVQLECSFDSSFINQWKMQKMLDQTCFLVQQFAQATGGQRLATINSLTPADQKQIWKWNEVYPSSVEECVHEIIQRRMDLSPEAPAVHSWDGDLTYRQLDDCSRRLACHIRSLDVCEGTLVLICFEKSMWTVVAKLAVLRAGGAFVMVEPSLPKHRVQSIVRQTGSTIALSSSLAKPTISLLVTQTVIVDDTWLHASATAPSQVLPRVSPSSLMYIPFTSGTTGEPKGSLIPHSAFASAVHYQSRRLTCPDARVFDFASYSFDGCVQNSLMTLTVGGCICIPSESDRKDNLTSVVAWMRVNCMLLTPSVARLVDFTRLPLLKQLNLGGEAIRAADINRVPNNIRIVNNYGPSECTVNSLINDNQDLRDELRCLGTGAGARTWVVDPEDHDRLLPVGAVGELLLEGPIVGRGYIGNPERTALSFIDAPAWLESQTVSGPRGKLYKTGDLVQYNETGVLTYVGRNDTQVKLRGQRIELGEVEHHVHACIPDTRVVVADIVYLADNDSTATLAAFVMFNESEVDHAPNGQSQDHTSPHLFSISKSVQDQLLERVPSYMVPTIWVAMDKWPLTVNSKIDRKALRQIGASFTAAQLMHLEQSAHGNKRPPTSEAELVLSQLFTRVLNLDSDTAPVSIDESFLRIGGDSITAMQVSAEARARGLNISTAAILRHKTIAAILDSCKSSLEPRVKGGVESLLLSDKHATGQPYPLSPIQQLFFQYQPNPTVLFDQCFLLGLRQHVTLEALRNALYVLTSTHSSLRSKFQQNDRGEWEQRTDHDASGAFQVCHLEDVEDLRDVGPTILNCRKSLNIAKGPLVAAVIFSVRGKQRLFMSIHHLVVDLVSWRALLGDLENLLAHGILPNTPGSSFASYCELQKEYAAAHANIDEHLPFTVQPPMHEYWGMSDTQGTFTPYSTRTTSETFCVDEPRTAVLLGEGNDAFGTRSPDLMLAALFYSFGRVFNDRPLPTVFNESHGREAWNDCLDLSTTVGWFTTFCPIQVDCDQNAGILDLVRRVKDCNRSIPQNGWQYFTSRFTDQIIATEFVSSFPVEVMFNYSGRYQQLERHDSLFQSLSMPTETFGPLVSEEFKRQTVLDVLVSVEKGCLTVKLLYNQGIKHSERMSSWAAEFQTALEHLAEELHGRRTELTLADFPGAFESYDNLAMFEIETLPRMDGDLELTDIEAIFPCTPMQEAILIGQAKDPMMYRTRLDIELRLLGGSKNIDMARLQWAWKQVVQRHTLLRAVLVDDFPGSSRVMHVVLGSPNVQIDIKTNLDKHSISELLDSKINGYTELGLQHHLTLCQLSNGEAHLMLEMNHAIVDAHSTNILMQELSSFYNGAERLPLAQTYHEAVSFVDSKPHQEGVEYWVDFLVDVEQCHFPELDYERVAHPDSHEFIMVPDIDTERMRAICATWELTPAIVIQVAWATVLKSYTGLQRPCFGVICSGRDHPVDRIDSIFGPLIGMITACISLGSDERVIDVLKTAQSDYLTALPHQTVALAAVHSALGLGTSALFNSILSFQKGENDFVGGIDQGLSMRIVDGVDLNDVSAQFDPCY
jgi:amino acid adenylation domain-containing protein/non-ribosomal peptide synthase protein (TIGR01720 family)